MTLKEFCEKENKQYLLDEWDEEKNLPFTTETVSSGSKIPVWWKCKEGHSWQTQVRSRAKTLTRCPKCIEIELAVKREQQMEMFKERFVANKKTPKN